MITPHNVPYQHGDTPDQKKWFDKKVSDLFALGFIWAPHGYFNLTRIWSATWEQVVRYNQTEWAEYLEAINEAIIDSKKYLKNDRS